MTAVRVDMSDGIARFVRARIGPFVRADFCGWDHGVSDVWECRGADGRRWYVKSCRDNFDQEVHAYRTWAPQLRGWCPELIGADDRLRVLILSAVDGALAEGLDLNATAEAEAHRRAGSLLSALHASSVDHDEVDSVRAFVERAERWDRRAAKIVSEDDRAWTMARLAEIEPMLSGIRRTPCHRDYAPRNWMIDTDGTLRMIDFGHTRADYWIFDVDKLWSDQWVDRPDRQAAFWDGYGVYPTDDEWNALKAVSALGALTTIVWSREHGDAAYEAHGRDRLARLRERQR